MNSPATTAPTIEPGFIKFFVPPDWFDLMADGGDRQATRARCAELIRLTYPDTPDERREEFTDVLMFRYDHLFANGVLMNGVVTAPLPSTGAQVVWQVYAGIVAVPPGPPELDLGALLSRVFDEAFLEGMAYVERFTTDMGIGVGFMAQPPVEVPTGWEIDVPPNLRTGLAGVLSCPPEGGRGLLVMGTCLDPDQVRELAGLVAVIAGHSVFVTPESK
ncbi:hypothetical protein ACFWY6_10660 [Streptomyces sp. NPDC059037]|uniref:hypothetical protein n=1 Tax=Streptomyces sp. NPDC059037 TaxID=3346710 RepID=UPI0036894A64